MISLKQHLNTQHRLTTLCEKAVRQQIARGDAPATQLRQRRRHLLKALRKHIPQSKRTPEKILHAAVMVLALWGFAGIAVPNTAQAAATFEHRMLEGFDVGNWSKPSLVDIDGDGDLDAFVGERLGTVKFYQNNGTDLAPSFVAANGVSVVNPLAGVDVGMSASPVFADIDDDGDLDAFVGASPIGVKFYQNNGSISAPSFVAADGVVVINPLAVVSVSSASPTFVDIDNDGDLDAFVGAEGISAVSFFRNYSIEDGGTASAPRFVAASGANPLSGILSSRFVPTFVDIDDDGDMDVFMGDGDGTVMFYQNDGDASTANFSATNGTTVINQLAGFGVRGDTAPTFADIDNDGDMDAFIGENTGTVKFYRNYSMEDSSTASVPRFVGYTANDPFGAFDMGYASIPYLVDIDNDGDMDAFVGDYYGAVQFYQNNGTSLSPDFAAANGTSIINPLTGVAVSAWAAPTFADIDSDGDLDAFVGERGGTVMFYRNTGTVSASVFSADAAGNPLDGFDVGYNAIPVFADIDGDGDLDAFVGEINGTVKFYRNYSMEDSDTASAPRFVGVTTGNPLAVVNTGTYTYAAPILADVDNDGDLDAFVGMGIGTVKFYQNNGTASVPNFVAADGSVVINPLAGFGFGGYANPFFSDIDNDGDLDLFVGELNGGVKFFENLEPHPPNTGTSSSGGSGGGGGGAPGLPLLTALAALLPWRKWRSA